jgi:hypothetical protein
MLQIMSIEEELSMTLGCELLSSAAKASLKSEDKL